MALHVAKTHIYATAELLAGYEFFDFSASTTTALLLAEGSISAEARIKSGKQIFIGAACGCCGPGTATAVGAEGDGLFNFVPKTIEGTASVSADANIAITGTGIFSGTALGTASASLGATVEYIASVCDGRLDGDAVVFGEAFVNQWASILGQAFAVADFRHIGQSSNTAAPFQNSTASLTASVIYNSNFGDMLGQAFLKAPTHEGTASISAKASTHEISFIYYSNGLLKLKNVSSILLNYLPTYMAEGEIVKRIMEIFGYQIQRIIYDRDGYPPDLQAGLLQQLFLDRATWGLQFWEEMAGLPIDPTNTDYTTRRQAVEAQLFGRKRESEFWFKARLEALTGGTVYINPEDPAEKPYEIEIESNVMLGEDSPSTAMDVVAVSGTGPLTGSFTYRCTFVFLTGETDSGDSESPSIIVTSKKTRLSDIPISSSIAHSRKIYRRRNPDVGTGIWHYVATIPDNVTTVFVDDVPDSTVLSAPELSPYNTATTVLGTRFLDLVNKTRPAHLHTYIRSERFRASINSAGQSV